MGQGLPDFELRKTRRHRTVEVIHETQPGADSVTEKIKVGDRLKVDAK